MTMKLRVKIFFVIGFVLVCLYPLLAAAAAESASSATRGRYLAGQGIIIPPEEVYTDSYIASIDYKYPLPPAGQEAGIYLYNSTSQMSRQGQEGIFQVGIQGKSVPFAELPPMNLAFVVDISSSMSEEDKIAWVREAVAVFMNKIRDVDSLALVSYNDEAKVIFESTRMDTPQKRRRFLEAVNGLSPGGGTDMEEGLAAGYQQVLANFREGSVNRVLLFSDGTEFSSRLSQAGAQSGDVRVSLIWNNRNDLDLHVVTPRSEEIYYARRTDSTGGQLDVDMNVSGETTKPVENIFWGPGQAPQGQYRVVVRNYAYHEPGRGSTPFKIEVKNGNEYSYYDGAVSGTAERSDVSVCTFEYKGASALKREKALIYQLAETYRNMGISISTIGVGVGFDLELMQNLAREGGGSSRFLSDREEMVKTFDTEFERMAVLVARDLEMELEFMPGVEILETWGYQNKVEGRKIRYELPGLHLGDYETILVRYRLLPQGGSAGGASGEQVLARFRMAGRDIMGKELRFPEAALGIFLTHGKNPLDGISNGMVLHSGTMMRLAETLKEVGTLYYAGRDDLDALSRLEYETAGQETISGEQQRRMDDLMKSFLGRLENALAAVNASSEELENVRLRLDDSEAFGHELEILAKYREILAKEIADNGGSPAGTGGMDTDLPPAAPADMEAIQNKVAGLFKEISLSFPEGQRSVAALASFALRQSGGSPGSGAGVEVPEPAILSYLNESALVALSGDSRITLVERRRLEAVMEEQKLQLMGILDTDSAIKVGELLAARYIITGQVIPMASQVIVFGRVIDVETGEIISAAQVFLDSAAVGDLLQ